jgi:uncharacterized protein YndB with AHSA1/START domain
MSTLTETETATQTFQVYVKATPQQVWDALTQSEWAQRYGYRAPIEYDLRAGGTFRSFPNEGMKTMGGVPDVIVDGEVLEAEAPRRLVQTWRMLFDETMSAEPLTRLTYEVEEAQLMGPAEGAVTKLTVTHDVTDAPTHAALVSGSVAEAGGGWPFILSDLKSLLETGTTLGR